ATSEGLLMYGPFFMTRESCRNTVCIASTEFQGHHTNQARYKSGIIPRIPAEFKQRYVRFPS
ncbi:MAG: hypothetical protein ACXACF_09155, partial [Candidatus Hermodarchaeia archaeon]